MRANGDDIECSTWVADRAVRVGEEVTVLVEFTAPQKPGMYFACYRLVQGNNNRFGDKIFLNLTVKDKAAEKKDDILRLDAQVEDIKAKPEKPAADADKADAMLRSQKMVEDVDKFAEGEDLDNSIVIEDSGAGGSGEADEKLDWVPNNAGPSNVIPKLGSALIEEVEPEAVQTGDRPVQANVLLEEKSEVPAVSLKIDESNGPSALAAPDRQVQNQPDGCADDSMLAAVLQSEYNRAERANPQKQAPVVASPEPMPVLKQSEQASIDVQKVAYLEKLNTAHYNKDFKDNLSALMSMGFLDFAKNLILLQQNHNNLEPVLGKLIDNP